MENILIEPTTVAHWHKLVNEAESASGVKLSEPLENYLVILLIRFTERTDMAANIMGLSYLETSELAGHFRQQQLRDVGDQCLLLTGFFPERATRRLVSLNYYVELGQRAYYDLSQSLGRQIELAGLYQSLTQHFVRLLDTLLCVRELGNEVRMSLIQAEELWRKNGSRQAFKTLRKKTKGIPLFYSDDDQKTH